MNFFQFFLSISALINLFQSFNLESFGAKSNNASYETALLNGNAFRKGIIAANSSQTDRTLVIESGQTYTMLPPGLLSQIINVTIQLNGRINAWYGDEKLWPNNGESLFSFSDTQGLVIKGNGVIDGFGYSWWVNVILTGKDHRPNLIDIHTLKDTLIDGIQLYNAAEYFMNFRDALNITVQNVIIHTDINSNASIMDLIPTFPLNTDGIDISGRDVYFRNLTITNFDDAVAVKPLSVNGGKYSNCTENILIEDCYVKYGVGMSIGSVPPNNNNNCIRNVTFRNIKFQDPFKAIYIKPNPGDHGTGIISNILYENIEIHNALWWAIFIGTQQQHQPHDKGTPCSFFYPLPFTECITNPRVTIENITLRNVKIFGGIFSPGIMICNATNPCHNFVFDNVNAYGRSYFPISQGYLCQNINGTVKNSTLAPSCLTNLDKNKFLVENK